ncbi:Rossmann-fold NAD(P)-binding domain-containing protein [Arthrobacter citreus]|uniref:hypothetical protein n=1 Tax=Arthrobacter citreus TaxID=1670 RepID=UPI0036D8F19A
MEQSQGRQMQGRTVLVTGATGGIGLATAQKLAAMANSYSGARAYSQSKLANVLFTYELARKLEGSRVTANVLHPGIVSTSFGTEDPGAAQRVFVPLLRPLMQRAEAGAATSVRLASASELEAVSGTYFSRGKVRRSSRRSYDQRAAARLWAISAALTRLSDNR